MNTTHFHTIYYKIDRYFIDLNGEFRLPAAQCTHKKVIKQRTADNKNTLKRGVRVK